MAFDDLVSAAAAGIGKPREETVLEQGLVAGVAAFRWATLVWAAVVLALDTTQDPQPARPLAGSVILAAAGAWTVAAGVLARTAPGSLLAPWAIAVELAVAVPMAMLDWWVYGTDAGVHTQALGTVWPLAVVLTAGVAGGARAGLATGVLIGLAYVAGDLTFRSGTLDSGRGLGSISAVVLYGLGGAVAGLLAARLRDAERRIAVARAREEVARTLHDGVLQTLAVVQRRSEDAALVALAHEQEHELREFLFSTRTTTPRSQNLATRLRALAATAERRHGLRCDVVLADPDAQVPEPVIEAVAGAVGEALTNAVKHGGATRATIYAEHTDTGGLFCTVKDDGCGFDPAAVADGVGIARSIKGRLADIGGTATVESRPGRGAEVLLRIASI